MKSIVIGSGFGGIAAALRLRAKNHFKQAREKVLKDIGIKKEALEKEIDKEVNKAEIEIKTFRDSAPGKIKKIAEETSSDLLKELIGAEVNSSSISAIVEDLSRKKMDEYYGN